VQEHHYLSRNYLYRHFLCHVLETLLLHSFQKVWRFVAAGVGDNRLTASRKELRHEGGQGSGVLALVEDIRGDDQVEGPDALWVRFAPVEGGDLRFQIQVRAGVVDRKVEGGLVMVCGEYSCAADERQDGRQSDTAPQLDGLDTSEFACREMTSQGEGARPEFGPVRETLVTVEVFLVDQFVRRDGMRDMVRTSPDLDRGLS